MAGMGHCIKSPSPPAELQILFGDLISLCPSCSQQDLCHYTKRPGEDGVPDSARFSPLPSGEKRKQRLGFPFSRLEPTANTRRVCFETRSTSWTRVAQHIKHHLLSKGLPKARMRRKYDQKSALESMLQLESVIAYLQETASFSTDAGDEPLVWLMKNEMLLQRIYERLRFLYYRLVVYAIACLWSYSEFPGRIRPPCTTMPWTIWPALIVLWGVCWMFYPSPGRATGATELESHSQLDYQLQPEEYGGDLLFSGLDATQQIPHSLEDSPFSDEWWALHQPSTIYDSLTMTMPHDIVAHSSDSARQLSLTAAVGPAQSPTNAAHLGSVSQPTISPGFQQQSQNQGIGPVAEVVTDNIVTTTSGPKTTNRFLCSHCYKVLSRRDALDRHLKTQHNQEVEENLCPYKPCKRSKRGSGFPRVDGLQRHLKVCKSRPRRVATVSLEPTGGQPNSGNQTREDNQARSSRQDTCSTQDPNDGSSQQSPANSWVEELRKRREEAREVCERKKRKLEEAQREFEAAQRVVASYETLIEDAEKERAV